jgi:simple sugar transport system permease protein
MRTGIPSFLITLGTFFILRGANLGVTKLVTGSVSSPNINQMDGYKRTRIGNWIYAVGGNADSARAVGVPVLKVKVGLFMAVAFLGWFTGMHYLYNFNVLQANNGVGNEFLYIIAAVVGGTLLTGGYGNAFGVAIGAFIFGMTSLGIVYAGWDPNWFYAFLGVMLLLAVVVNLYVKKLSTTRKVG